MKIALITTRAAKDIVNSVVKDIREHEIHIYVLNSVPIAALATIKDVISDMRGRIEELRKYDLVILPGLIRGSAKELSRLLGVKVIKGTIYAGDLPILIKFIDEGVDFSTEVPADAVIGDYLRRVYDERLSEIMKRVKPQFNVKNVIFVDKPPPMNLFMEVNIDSLENKKIKIILNRLCKHNYQGIVLGCASNTCNKKLLRSLIYLLQALIGH